MSILQETAQSADTAPPAAMSNAAANPVASTDSVRMVETRDGLAAFKEPAAELVIWERRLPPQFRHWIDGMDAAALPHLRVLVRPNDLRQALDPEFDACGLVAGAMRDFLLEDIDGLVSAFAEITRSDLVDVRLARIDNDACWKFHRDSLEARLLTTYRGPATEWVPSTHAERAIEAQRDYDGPLEQLGDGDVALFKGSQAGPNSGVVHRSPPIEGAGFTRLLLCLNKRTVVSPDLWEGH